MSGAATYWLGDSGFNATANALIRFSFFSFEIFVGSAIIPDFAPPKGSSATAHFQVMVLASLKTSSTLTVGVILIPPLPRPKAVLSITKIPCVLVWVS